MSMHDRARQPGPRYPLFRARSRKPQSALHADCRRDSRDRHRREHRRVQRRGRRAAEAAAVPERRRARGHLARRARGAGHHGHRRRAQLIALHVRHVSRGESLVLHSRLLAADDRERHGARGTGAGACGSRDGRRTANVRSQTASRPLDRRRRRESRYYASRAAGLCLLAATVRRRSARRRKDNHRQRLSDRDRRRNAGGVPLRRPGRRRDRRVPLRPVEAGSAAVLR